ncbi:solute carrier organic anion transporter family, member 1D1 [Salarias fasciatus]|nr:solute carrier organic anion transporter family member 1C1-like [Salarias fasciatus]
MAFACFAKAFGGAYMKSAITQIERRFDIPSSHSGAIDGSFEMGNLLVIAFVSYFGSKFHRPRLIGAGCLVMAAGSFITALPHFFQDLYKYETSVSVGTGSNKSLHILPCVSNSSLSGADGAPDIEAIKACEKAIGSSMWIYVFLGNMLRGIGETPIMPLGLSYLDDFASEENTPFYIAIVQTVGIIGPIGGFLLGSYLSKIYVDVGFVDLDEVTITYKDSRWVGAWWLGFIVTGLIITLSSIPFWFLPKSIRKEGEDRRENAGKGEAAVAEQESFLSEEKEEEKEEEQVTCMEMAKDMGPSLKRLFSNKVYMLLVLTSLIAVNGFIGMITFKPKYMEQVFGQASSRAIFLIGIMNLPAVALGIIGGGLLLKKMKLGVVGAARLAMTSSILSCCLLILQAFIRCNQAEVAGLTVSYQGVPEISFSNQTLLSQCNSGCSCSLKQWDPVCAHNGMTYVSPCLAGCQSSSGASKDLVYHNCSCIGELMTPSPNMSVVLGQCPRKDDCNRMFKVYMALSVTGSFISAFGGTSSYIVLLRSIEADLKSFALGMQTLIVRTLGGIPPPIYFGALIDQTCLKWGTKQCGGVGACRLYDSHAFRLRFMGLVSGLYVLANVTWGALYTQIVKKQKRLAQADGVAANGVACDGAAANGAAANGHAMITVGLDADMIEKESTI